MVDLIFLVLFVFYVYCAAQFCAKDEIPIGLFGFYLSSVFILAAPSALLWPLFSSSFFYVVTFIWNVIYINMIVTMAKMNDYNIYVFYMAILFLLYYTSGFIYLEHIRVFLAVSLFKMIYVCYNGRKR